MKYEEVGIQRTMPLIFYSTHAWRTDRGLHAGEKAVTNKKIK